MADHTAPTPEAPPPPAPVTVTRDGDTTTLALTDVRAAVARLFVAITNDPQLTTAARIVLENKGLGALQIRMRNEAYDELAGNPLVAGTFTVDLTREQTEALGFELLHGSELRGADW